MGNNPHTNGGVLRKELLFPAIEQHAVEVHNPGSTEVENTYLTGEVILDLILDNKSRYRLFGLDETHSNRLQAVYEATKKSGWRTTCRRTFTAVSYPTMAR